MNKILLVDDDALVVEIYRKRMTHFGYEVVVAPDGLAAMKALHEARPQFVVLDIMMPKFNGWEVLNFIRSQVAHQGTRVVVLSNFYAGGDERQATTAQADDHLLKSTCTPAKLDAALKELAARPPRVAAPATKNPPVEKPAAAPPPTPPPVSVAQTKAAAPGPDTAAEAKIRAEFLKDAPKHLATLQQLNAAFMQDGPAQARDLHLLDYYRKVHYLTAIAGMGGCAQIALLCSAFEALLMELHERPEHIGPSTRQTITFTLDFLTLLFDNAEIAAATPSRTARALVVDDDPISVRAISMALRRCNLVVVGLPDPNAALQAINSQTFDLILLDVLMPGMDGFELCKKLRALPQYQQTPVIFVTGKADFESRSQGVLSGGNDLIAKPVLPIELALKAVTHLLRPHLPQPPALI